MTLTVFILLTQGCKLLIMTGFVFWRNITIRQFDTFTSSHPGLESNLHNPSLTCTININLWRILNTNHFHLITIHLSISHRWPGSTRCQLENSPDKPLNGNIAWLPKFGHWGSCRIKIQFNPTITYYYFESLNQKHKLTTII